MLDETSIRYDGWRIVAVCFLVATFGWGLGFYGQSVYVAELQRLHSATCASHEMYASGLRGPGVRAMAILTLHH